MSDTPKRKSALSRPSQQGIGARSIEQFVARANEELSALATEKALETREAREDELRREVERVQLERAREVDYLKSQLASRRRRARAMILGAFVLGAAAMFGIDLARAPAGSASQAQPPPRAAIESPPPAPPAATATVTPSAVTPPAAVTPPPAVTPPVNEAPPANDVPAIATTPPAPVAAPPPPIAARPPKKKPPTTSPSPAPQTPAAPKPPPPPPPTPPEDLVNPF